MSFEVLALFLFVPVIAFVDFLVFGVPKSMQAEIKKHKWMAYVVPTFLEFLFFVFGYFVGKGVV